MVLLLLPLLFILVKAFIRRHENVAKRAAKSEVLSRKRTVQTFGPMFASYIIGTCRKNTSHAELNLRSYSIESFSSDEAHATCDAFSAELQLRAAPDTRIMARYIGERELARPGCWTDNREGEYPSAPSPKRARNKAHHANRRKKPALGKKERR
jgi:hypothetical protein